MIAMAGMTRVARMAGVALVTGVVAMTTVVMASVIGVGHGLSVRGMACLSRLHSVMTMILRLVHTHNLYPSGV